MTPSYSNNHEGTEFQQLLGAHESIWYLSSLCLTVGFEYLHRVLHKEGKKWWRDEEAK